MVDDELGRFVGEGRGRLRWLDEWMNVRTNDAIWNVWIQPVSQRAFS